MSDILLGMRFVDITMIVGGLLIVAAVAGYYAWDKSELAKELAATVETIETKKEETKTL